MDHLLTFRPKCNEDIIVYAKYVKKFRIYELLMSLNPKYEQLRVTILSKDHFHLNEVYAYLHREEKDHRTMVQLAQLKRSAFISSSQRGGRGGNTHGRGGGGRFSGTSDDCHRLKCEHYGHNHHTNDTCWDLFTAVLHILMLRLMFSRGHGGGCFGSNRSSAHSMTLAPSSESPAIVFTTPIASDGILSREQVEFSRNQIC